jgi:parallel beta-helix repeat protein
MRYSNFAYIIRLLFALFIIFDISNATMISVCPDGCNQSRIQPAINAADPGDIILVSSGLYVENINISKKLTLQGVDTGSGKPNIDADFFESGIVLSADGITLDGFNITNSSGPAYFNWSGIDIRSINNTICNNVITDSENGIIIKNSSFDIIRNNTISNNYGIGIQILSSNNISLIGNNISANRNGAILLNFSKNNSIYFNIINNSYDGLILKLSSLNYITNNTIMNSTHKGITSEQAIENYVCGNKFSNNEINFSLNFYFNNKVCTSQIQRSNNGNWTTNNWSYNFGNISNVSPISINPISTDNESSNKWMPVESVESSPYEPIENPNSQPPGTDTETKTADNVKTKSHKESSGSSDDGFWITHPLVEPPKTTPNIEPATATPAAEEKATAEAAPAAAEKQGSELKDIIAYIGLFAGAFIMIISTAYRGREPPIDDDDLDDIGGFGNSKISKDPSSGWR